MVPADDLLQDQGIGFAGAHLVRVHDVHDMVQVARVCDALRGAPGGSAC